MTVEYMIETLENDIKHLQILLSSKCWQPNEHNKMIEICNQIEKKQNAIMEIKFLNLIFLASK